MRRLVLLAVVLLCMPLYAQLDKSLERPFAAGGQVKMELEGGDYKISPTDTNHIAVTWEQRGNVEVKIDTNGGTAKVSTIHTPHNNFHCEIEVPRTSDLYIRLSAGNLDIGAIKGNKDVESHAGNVDIAVVNPEDYSRVDASLLAGNIDASPFQGNKSGLFRSFDWHGNGRYRLHAHLMAGNLNLHAAHMD